MDPSFVRRSLALTLVALGWQTFVRADEPTADQKRATVNYVRSLQKANGGFAPDAKSDSVASVPATSAAVRAIKHFGGEVPKPDAVRGFLESCLDKATGGFRPTPGGGAPDVRTTAVGIMAMAELTSPARAKADLVSSIVYLGNQAKTFEDVRIAAAAFDSSGTDTSALSFHNDWVNIVLRMRNPDGTYGKEGNLARDTAGAVVTLLRLGAKVDQRDKVVDALRRAQRTDGGWGREGERSSDLESIYRVMRAFMMLRERPEDVAKVRAFVSRCRNADGSYSVQPGQAGSVSATYYASMILSWLDTMK